MACSFLAKRFKAHIQDHYQQVRTRYRTPEQEGLLERFRQTLKREEVYWQPYESPADAREKLAAFRNRYNNVRPHWALQPAAGSDVVTPEEVCQGKVKIILPKWQHWARAAQRKLDEAKEKHPSPARSWGKRRRISHKTAKSGSRVTAWQDILAGIYGMNFDVIPELSWRHGYFALLAFMGLLTTTLLIVFRIKRWI
jgi:hypothetical protein